MMEQYPFLAEIYLGNTVLAYLKATVIFFGGVAGLFVLEKFVILRLGKLAEKTSASVDDFLLDILDKNVLPILYAASFYFAAGQLVLSGVVSKAVLTIFIFVLVFQATKLAIQIFVRIIQAYMSGRGGVSAAVRTIITVTKVVVWGIAIVFLLDNLGFNVSAVIAGLGIGGVAVALAAQTILGDLFNYFVIFFDKPFEEGDFVIVGDFMGVIEHIGIKSTRIRSLGGEQLVFSNSDLSSSRIRNYKRMRERRIVFGFGVVYQTKAEQMKRIPELIKKVIESIKLTRFDRAHFKAFGNFSLDFEVVYYVLESDYNKYMDVQQEINLKIQEMFERQGIDFAYPTQTLFIEKTNPGPVATSAPV